VLAKYIYDQNSPDHFFGFLTILLGVSYDQNDICVVCSSIKKCSVCSRAKMNTLNERERMFLVKNKYSNILLLEILLLATMYYVFSLYLYSLGKHRTKPYLKCIRRSDDVNKYWTCADKGFQLYLINLPTDKASLYSVKCKSIRSIEKTVAALLYYTTNYGVASISQPRQLGTTKFNNTCSLVRVLL